MKKILAIDLDGCIAKSSPGLEQAPGGYLSWERFFKACIEAKLDAKMRLLANESLRHGWEVFIVSCRPEIVRWQTVTWLQDNTVQYSQLLLNTEKKDFNDLRFKRDLYESARINKEGHFILYEDDPEIFSALSKEGHEVVLHQPLQF